MLPREWIDRLFARFGAMYGAQWVEKWRGIDPESIKDTWAEDLAGCNAEQLRKGLEHAKAHCNFPPSLPEFLGICRQFRDRPENVVYLNAPAPRMPPHIAAALKEFVEGKKRGDCKDWARKILAEPGAYPHISKQFAEEALGIGAAA